MPGPRAVQNLQMSHPRDWQGGQMPRSSPGRGGGWAQIQPQYFCNEKPMFAYDENRELDLYSIE